MQDLDSTIQELKTAHLSVIPVKPEHDKEIRMGIQSAKFESGQVFFPKVAPWLADLEAELSHFQAAGTTIRWTA